MIEYGDPETWGMTVDQFLDTSNEQLGTIELADGGVVEREGFKDGPDQYEIAQNKQAERMKKIKPLIEKGYSKTEIGSESHAEL